MRTGGGLSEYADVGAVVGQGTIAGALGSQAVLDEGISESFSPGNGDELNYGTVAMAPLLFQDDLIHATQCVDAARRANIKINIVVNMLNLCLHKNIYIPHEHRVKNKSSL